MNASHDGVSKAAATGTKDRAALRQAALRGVDWLQNAGFGLWAGSGRHPQGGFREQLELDGRPILEGSSRTMVQARQTFVYCIAHRLGWSGAMPMALEGAHTLLAHGRLENGLFGHRIAHGHGLDDPRVELYGNAFALFALVHAYGVSRDTRLLLEIERTSDAIEKHRAIPDFPGLYWEEQPGSSTRIQNHHMHLYEAYLAAFEATGNERHLQRSCAIESATLALFVDGDGFLHVCAALDASPAVDDRLEAGHHFEWCYLLSERARLSGEPFPQEAGSLLERGQELTLSDGRCYLSHNPDFTVREQILRTWTQTEYLKANVSAAAAGMQEAAGRIIECVEILFEDHLLDNGGWVDLRDPSGTALSARMPASTGYHVTSAFYELAKLAEAESGHVLQLGDC